MIYLMTADTSDTHSVMLMSKRHLYYHSHLSALILTTDIHYNHSSILL